jgi:hypothetical protein
MGLKYLDSIKTAWKNTGKKLSQKFKRNTAKFYTYNDITLQNYLTIAQTMDLKGLLIKGKASEKELFEKWEELVRENYKLNGGFDYLNYCDVIEGYNYLIAEYNVVKCTLIQLMFFVDDNYISELNEKGYRIDTKDSLSYVQSINAAMRKSDGLITRMKMKSNEIAGMLPKDGQKAATFEEIMAGLTICLEFDLPEGLKLARFNEYKKIINERNQKHVRDN